MVGKSYIGLIHLGLDPGLAIVNKACAHIIQKGVLRSSRQEATRHCFFQLAAVSSMMKNVGQILTGKGLVVAQNYEASLP